MYVNNHEIIWQNEIRRSGPLAWSVGEQRAGKNRERKVREECGTGKPENGCSILAPSPLSLFNSPFLMLHPN